MALDREYNDMLNEYITYPLLKEEVVKRSYILQRFPIKKDWKSGTFRVAFKASGFNSIRYGKYTADDDIAKMKLVKGSITNMPKVVMSLIFDHEDLVEHDGKVTKDSFLKLMPDSIDDSMQGLKESLSCNVMNGSHMATLQLDGDNSGTGRLTVDRVERFSHRQKVQIVDDNSLTPLGIYVIAIDVNASRITVSLTRDGTAASMSDYTTAQNAKIYYDGASATNASLTSLRSALLPSSITGGADTLYGETKLTYAYLQSYQCDATETRYAITALTGAGILAAIFNGITDTKQFGKGNPTEAWLSYKRFGHAMAELESTKGPYNVIPNSNKANPYGWQEIIISGPSGAVKLVAINEMDHDIIPLIDVRAFEWHTNNFIEKRTSPSGQQYYEKRTEDGFFYITDLIFRGDFVCHRPSHCGIIHSIPAPS